MSSIASVASPTVRTPSTTSRTMTHQERSTSVSTSSMRKSSAAQVRLCTNLVLGRYWNTAPGLVWYMRGTTRNEKFTVPSDLLAAPVTEKYPASGVTENRSSSAPSSSTAVTMRVCKSSSRRSVATALTTPATSLLRAKSVNAFASPTMEMGTVSSSTLRPSNSTPLRTRPSTEVAFRASGPKKLTSTEGNLIL